MGRQAIADPLFRKLAREGMQFLRNPPPDFSETPLIDNRGSLLFFSDDDEDKAKQLVQDSRCDDIEIEQRSPTAIFTPSDGLIDIHALLYGFLKPVRTAHKLVCNAKVISLEYKNEHWMVTTRAGRFSARTIINAAGAWADQVAVLAGAAVANLQIRRRHLFVSAPSKTISRDAPFIWDLSRHYYYRPESGGVMMSPCDEDITSPEEAYSVSDAAVKLLHDKLNRYCPQLSGISIAKTWAGARTFTPTGGAFVCWDPIVPHFLWVAGLGGHGATCSAAIGQQAAALIQGNSLG